MSSGDPAPARPAPPAMPAGIDATDATAAFLGIYEEIAGLGTRWRVSMPPAAYDCEFLFAPGLLTHWNAGYFAPNLERMSSLGLSARVTWAGHPMGAVEANGEAIRRELEAAPKPVVVIGHSKGALDTWSALAQWPGLASKLRAFAAVQSPVFGSEVADWYASGPAGRLAMRMGARLLGGSERAVWDLTTAARVEFVEKHPFPVDKVPAWSIVTTFDRRLHRFYLGRYAMRRRGAAASNDGMVSGERGVIPGSRVVRLADMDHLDAVSGSDGLEQFISSTSYDAATFTEALVRLIFS